MFHGCQERIFIDSGGVFFAATPLAVLADDTKAAEDTQHEAPDRAAVLSFNRRALLAKLEDALAVHDEIPTLEESRMIGRDQRSAKSDLDKLLNDVIELFGSPMITSLRRGYGNLEQRLEADQARLARYRSERVMVTREEVSLRSRLVPTETLRSYVAVSRADYDKLIENTEVRIKQHRAEMAENMALTHEALLATGVELEQEQLEALLSSVVGDDIVSMSVVFNAIRDMTLQLATLTEESGENLAHAKTYYGMVVILHQVMIAMQENFINDVDERYLPSLASFRDDANANIDDARALIRDGISADALSGNIQSNELTLQVINLYERMLKDQRQRVANANKASRNEMRVADNTYRTVTLSSAVANLIREGGNAFDHLINLQMPDVRSFQNEQIREEFRQLTSRLKG